MTMTIQINTTYRMRNGDTFRVMALTGQDGTYAVMGEDSRGRLGWRSLKGRFTRGAHSHDLVAVAA
jgi:hypothetical protein